MTAQVSETGSVPTHLLTLLADMVANHGADAAELALRNAYQYEGVRGLSKLSLRTAAACVEEGFPATLVTKLDPKAKNRGERVEIRVLTGNEIDIHGS